MFTATAGLCWAAVTVRGVDGLLVIVGFLVVDVLAIVVVVVDEVVGGKVIGGLMVDVTR